MRELSLLWVLEYSNYLVGTQGRKQCRLQLLHRQPMERKGFS